MRRRRLDPPLAILYRLADELAQHHPRHPLTDRCGRCPGWMPWPCPSASFAAATKHDATRHDALPHGEAHR